MIVVDANIISYLHLPTKHTASAEQLLEQAPMWAVPYLWRSEFRNVLTQYLRASLITYDKALGIMAAAEELLRGNEYAMNSLDVLALANASTLSGYDCEYVALAQVLQVPLVTEDKKILKAFPNIALPLKKALVQGN